MRIFIVYRHYWPDSTSYAHLLKSIAERLAKDGHDVRVFTAQPSYNDVQSPKRPWRETINGVQIIRVPLLWERKTFLPSRLVNSGLFMLASLVYGLSSERPDLIMTVSTPPAFMGCTARLLSKLTRSNYLYHCQDLNPEAARIGGKLANGLIYRLLMWADKAAQRDAAAVVVLSEDMQKTIQERGLSTKNVYVQNNFMLELSRPAEPPPGLQKPERGIFRVLFAGNHGVFQGLDHVIEAARILSSHPSIRFQFVGEGLAKSRLVAQAGDMVDTNVFFHSWISAEQAFRVMQESHLGLVTLAPEIYKYAYPSKMMPLLTAGLPVLAAVESTSELARFVTAHGLGWACPPQDPESLARAIYEAYRAPLDLERRRRKCIQVAQEHFGPEVNLNRWSNLVAGLQATR